MAHVTFILGGCRSGKSRHALETARKLAAEQRIFIATAVPFDDVYSVKWIAIAFTLFIALIIVLAALGKLGFLGRINSIPYGDKAGHFILYGILTLLVDLALFRSLPDSSRRLLALRVALILTLLIGLRILPAIFSQPFL